MVKGVVEVSREAKQPEYAVIHVVAGQLIDYSERLGQGFMYGRGIFIRCSDGLRLFCTRNLERSGIESIGCLELTPQVIGNKPRFIDD